MSVRFVPVEFMGRRPDHAPTLDSGRSSTSPAALPRGTWPSRRCSTDCTMCVDVSGEKSSDVVYGVAPARAAAPARPP